MNGFLNFFEEHSKNAVSFINCEVFPFEEELVNKDKCVECLK
jgi:hypothetical protein